MSATIFVIDDEVSITDTVQFALEREGFLVRVFHAGKSVIEAMDHEHPDLMILDVGLTDGSGFDYFLQYRQLCQAPVIFLTARNDEIDRVVGLEMGADDYIGKPFSLRELVARVRVVLRRSESNQNKPGTQERSVVSDDVIQHIHAFHFDSVRKQIHYYDQLLNLTAHEYKILELLLSQPGRVYSRTQLLEKAWDAPEHRLERSVDTHIKTLRMKLREVSADKDPIKTHRGMGYSFDPGRL